MITKAITWEKFLRDFKPIKNILEDNAPYDGFMFETYGPEFQVVQAKNRVAPGCVWTVLDDGDTTSIGSGYSHVNRLGYILTELPCPADMFIDVPDDEDDMPATSPTMGQVKDLIEKLQELNGGADMNEVILNVGVKDDLPTLWLELDSEYMPTCFQWKGEDILCNGDLRW